jgi:heat-inducible transcriptional repressor
VQDAFIASIRTQLNNAMAGQSLPDVAERITGIIEGYGPSDRRDISLIVSAVIDMAIEKAEEKVVLAGTANLARFSDDFQSTMHPVLEALEEQVVLLRLLGDAADTVTVRIGSEQSEKNLKSTSLVTVGYGDSGMPLGALGILGPTRMDYAGSMAAVGAVARYVGRFITEGSYK